MAMNNERVTRDQGNVGPDPRQARSLIPMRRLDNLRIAEGEPDIRGWTVFTSEGREVGEVQELLVDTTSMEVVMLDIDLKRDNRHSLAPIRAAWVDRPNKRVVIAADEIDTDDDIPALPQGTDLSDHDVEEFDRRYSRAYGARGAGDYDYRYRYGDHDELRFSGGAAASDGYDELEHRSARRNPSDLDDDALVREREELRREQERLAAEREQLRNEREELAEARERLEAERLERPAEVRRYVERRRRTDEDDVMPPSDRPYSVRFPHSSGRDVDSSRDRRADDVF